MQSQLQPLSKLDLKKKFEEELKVFLMIIKSSSNPPEPGTKVGSYLSYKPEQAMQIAVKDNPGKIIFYQNNYIIIKDLLERVSLSDKINIIPTPKTKSFSLDVSQKPLTKEQFIWNLNLAVDKFVKNKKDKVKVQEVIKNIK